MKKGVRPQVSKSNWHGIEAWELIDPDLSVIMVPEMGAKIVSLFDRRTETEWLIGPGDRPLQPAAYGASFTEQDMSGWDEMFPTIVSCPYPGSGKYLDASLPDHGEAWCLPWQVVQAEEGEIVLRLQGRALPYQLTRTADLPEQSTLHLSYTLQNLGSDPMPFLWAAHPQFTCEQDGQVVFPPEINQVINTLPESWGWGTPETHWDWPESAAPNASTIRIDCVGPTSLRRGRKFFALPDAKPAWAALLRNKSGQWLRFEWNPDQVPYLGLWVDEGALNHDSVAALEPSTAWYDDLSLAYRKGKAPILPAGETCKWELIVRLGKGKDFNRE